MNRLQRFHRDEVGMSSLQVIMIVAIAAVILGLLKLTWWDIKNWFTVTVFPLMSFGSAEPD